jgi:hypothetical protein
MKKVICPIVKLTPHRSYRVYIGITFENGRLSISGVEGPLSNGNCLGACGQIVAHLSTEDRSEWEYLFGWDGEMVTELFRVWARWHLNDMRAGTPAQEEFVREWKRERRYDYTKVCEALEGAGLLVDNGYRYGTAWLAEEVPAEVIAWLSALPDAETQPAWV